MVGVDRDLRARAGDLVGDVEVGVADEDVALAGEDVADVVVAAVLEVEQHVLGQGSDAVGAGDALDEGGDGVDLGVVEAPQHPPLDPVHPATLGARTRAALDRCGRAGRARGAAQPTGTGASSSERAGAATNR